MINYLENDTLTPLFTLSQAGSRRERQSEIKYIFWIFKNFKKWVMTIVFMKKYGKQKNKDKTSLQKSGLDPEVGYVWERC